MADNSHMENNNMNKDHMDMAAKTNNYQNQKDRNNYMMDTQRTPEHQTKR